MMLTKTADLTDFATLKNLCEKLPASYEYALMTHDLDEGTDHYHVAIRTPNPTTIDAIAKKMQTPANFIKLWRGSTANMWAYLPHNTNTAKDQKADYNHYLTDPAKFATNLQDLEQLRYNQNKKNGAKNKKLDDTVKKILVGDITQKNLLHPDNIVFYHDNYNKLQRAIQLRTQSLRYNPPDCQTIYIQGPSNTGKTRKATKIAEKNYPNDWAFASAGNDPLQDYTGEKCLIFDDLRPQDYELNDLLAMLDPTYRNRTHKSRYYNKPLATSLIIITSNVELQDAIDYYTAYTKEDPIQLRRRIQTQITIDENRTATTLTYDEKLDGWWATQ